MDYFIFKDIDSRSINNLVVTSLPPITKPEMRVETIEVDGRDGDIVNELGYKSYEKKIKMFMLDDIDINYMLSWLNGEGKLILSNESDKYYNAKIISKIDIERLIKYKEIEIEFHVQPYKYLKEETYEQAEKKTVEGKEITIDDGISVLNNIVYGSSEQVTYTGKNLFNYIDNLNSSVNGLISTINSDGSITTTGIPTSNYVQIFNLIDITDLLENNQRYTAWQENTAAGINLRPVISLRDINTNNVVGYITLEGYISRGFTVDKSKYRYFINVQTDTTANWGTSSRTITNKYMLVKGTDTTFEPYVGGTPSPNPDFPQEINNVGVCNLFDENSEEKGLYYVQSNGSENRNALVWSQFNLIEVRPNTNYTLFSTYKEENSSFEITEFSSSKMWIKSEQLSLTSGCKSFETQATTKYIRIGARNDRGVELNIQFKEGNKQSSVIVSYGNWLVEKITGKNILNTPYTEQNKLTKTATKDDDYAITSYYVELEASKTYTFSCKASGTFGSSSNQTECMLLFDRNYDYIIAMKNKDGFTFTPSRTGTYYLRYDVNVKGETHSFWDFYIAEEKEYSGYEPYKEIIVKANLNKKQLFDSELELGTFDANGLPSSATTCVRTKSYIPVKPNTTYAITNNMNYQNVIQVYNSNKISIKALGNMSTFTTDNNTYFIKIRSAMINNENDLNVKYYLYEGTESFPYYEINEKDEVNLSNGLFIKRIGKAVFDGSDDEKWAMNTVSSYRQFLIPFAYYGERMGYSNRFIYNNNATDLIAQGNMFYFGTNLLIFPHPIVNGKDISTLEDFKSYLSSNPVTVYYVLKKPEVIQLEKHSISLYQPSYINVEGNVKPSNIKIDYLKTFEIENKGLEDSKPIIHIKGEGTVELKINGQISFKYTFDDDKEVYIDSEEQDAYLDNMLKNRNMQGDFPVLKSGMNKIEWNGFVEDIEILSRSRWL